MPLSKLNEALTLIANIGIVVGLVFVGLEFRNNSASLEMESRANVGDKIMDVMDVVLADPTLIEELMGKEKAELTTVESDRLRLLGIRMLMVMDNNFVDATERGLGNLESMRQVHRAIYHRPRLNYGLPYAWDTYSDRIDSAFVSWFEANVISDPPAG